MPENLDTRAENKRRKYVKHDNPIDPLNRQPPFNLEAEVGVLGSVMLMPDTCDEIVNVLRPADFYDEAHQILFRHITEMHGSGKKVDPLLLRERLIANNEFETIGGAARLAEIFTSVPNAAHVTYYANIVRTKATSRQLIETCSDLLNEAYLPEGDPDVLLNDAEQKVFAIRESRQSNNLSSIDEVLSDAMDRMEARMMGKAQEGTVETGFTDLDRMTGGLHASELVILAARAKYGQNGVRDEYRRTCCHQGPKTDLVYQP